MSSAALQHVVMLSWVTTLAALFVAVARVPLRSTLGARATYLLWLAVPGSALALALPHSYQASGSAAAGAPDILGWAWARADGLLAAIQAIHVSGQVGTIACAVWMTGAGAALGFMFLRQRSFARSLGTLVPSTDGTWRGRGVVEPMLLGALRPRVLVPLDFEQRYSAEEREFVLAHERAHMRRGDTLANALGAAWLCFFWFNPVMFWALRLLRFDQDLACDAAVLAAAGRSCRGRYAEALLKAQLAGEGVLPVPLACHWRSVHPLRRRIAALKRPVMGRLRHGIGILCVTTIVSSVSLGVHAAQPALNAPPAAPHDGSPANGAAAARAAGKVCPLALRRARESHQIRPRG